MLNIIKNPFVSTKVLSTAGIALVTGLALQPAPAHATKVNPRAFQAVDYDVQVQSEWRKPKSAEIPDGYCGPDYEVNGRTGEIRLR